MVLALVLMCSRDGLAVIRGEVETTVGTKRDKELGRGNGRILDLASCTRRTNIRMGESWGGDGQLYLRIGRGKDGRMVWNVGRTNDSRVKSHISGMAGRAARYDISITL